MKKSRIKELTRAEEEIMQILWRIEKGFVKDILEEMPSPKPAYNTVSTIVRILVKKGFVNYSAFGKTHEYHPAIGKQDYTNYYIKNFITHYFDGSFSEMVSFFTKKNDLNAKEVDELVKQLKENK